MLHVEVYHKRKLATIELFMIFHSIVCIVQFIYMKTQEEADINTWIYTALVQSIFM